MPLLSLPLRVRSVCVALVLMNIHCPNVDANNDGILDVAVIGSGIGGASAAYFLSELMPGKVRVQLFEKEDRIGGRLKTENVGGKMYEAGGSILHPRNRYMVHFAKKFGLKQKQDSMSGSFGIYNGDGFSFLGSSWQSILTFQMLWRYGWDLVRFKFMVRDMLDDFAKIYTLQESGEAFEDVEGMLGAMHPDFVGMLKISLREYLEEHGFQEPFIDELAQIAAMTNYGGQTVDDLHAFVGSVSLAGADSNLWSILGGNHLMARSFVDNAQGSVRLRSSHLVVQLKKDPTTNKVGVKFKTYLEPSNEHEALHSTHTYIEHFDAVVVACPLLDRMDDIQISGFTEHSFYPDKGPYHQTVATLIQGSVSPDAFHFLRATDLPTAILSNNKTTFFASLAQNSPVTRRRHIPSSLSRPSDFFFNVLTFVTGGSRAAEHQPEPQGPGPYPVWKIFSTKPLSNQEINYLFSAEEASKQVIWQAYPEYAQIGDQASSFYLVSREVPIYHLNTIEWAASAMEMSVISARNAALLVQRDLFAAQQSNFQENEDPASKILDKDEL